MGRPAIVVAYATTIAHYNLVGTVPTASVAVRTEMNGLSAHITITLKNGFCIHGINSLDFAGFYKDDQIMVPHAGFSRIPP